MACVRACPSGPEADGQGGERQRIRLWASHNHLASQLSATDVVIRSPAKQPGLHVWPLLSLPGFRLKPGRASWRMGGWGTEAHSMCPGASSLGPLPSMPWRSMCTCAFLKVTNEFTSPDAHRKLLQHKSKQKYYEINKYSSSECFFCLGLIDLIHNSSL